MLGESPGLRLVEGNRVGTAPGTVVFGNGDLEAMRAEVAQLRSIRRHSGWSLFFQGLTTVAICTVAALAVAQAVRK